MFGLIPKNENFFELFDLAAINIQNATRVLNELMVQGDDVEERVKRIKDLEHEGDKITHDTIKRLNKTFVTPIDREDIHELISSMDDVVDFIDNVASKYRMYKLSDPPEPVKELTGILLRAGDETVRAVSSLEGMDPGIHHICIEINSLENEADRISMSAIAKLFDGGMEPLDVMKWKELYETLEDAADAFEDVANTLEGIILKHT